MTQIYVEALWVVDLNKLHTYMNKHIETNDTDNYNIHFVSQQQTINILLKNSNHNNNAKLHCPFRAVL